MCVYVLKLSLDRCRFLLGVSLKMSPRSEGLEINHTRWALYQFLARLQLHLQGL